MKNFESDTSIILPSVVVLLDRNWRCELKSGTHSVLFRRYWGSLQVNQPRVQVVGPEHFAQE